MASAMRYSRAAVTLMYVYSRSRAWRHWSCARNDTRCVVNGTRFLEFTD